ncbi:MAG: NapC/NirT family cytochrome c [Dermatophilaceae bacterium]
MTATEENPTEATEVQPRRRFRRTRALFAPVGRVLAKIPHPPWHSKRGIFVLFCLVGGSGLVVGVGGLTAVHFSETAGFCGLCHTMNPQLAAYGISAHKDVACGECHVEPGLAGLVKAKLNGTKELKALILGNYPTPIEPPDHAKLPNTKDTCLVCHSKEKLTANGGPVKLILRPRYKADEANTRELVAIMLRPAGLGQPSATTGAAASSEESEVRGVHWHIDQKVTYTSSDERARKIDLVEITGKDGSKEQYIAGTEVSVSTDVKPDIDRLKLNGDRLMDCVDCHNRVGHDFPSPERAVDEAIADGRISTALPFIKRDGVALLNGDYPTVDAAEKAITALRTTYATKYPLVFEKHGAQVTGAINELKTIYNLVATPAMKVEAKTYPNNIGHQGSLGCFRCHDDAHFLVEKGRITNKKIPSTCATCHTFPQISGSASATTLGDKDAASAAPGTPVGADVVDFPLGARPATHKDKLYVFSHKGAVSKTDSAGTTCAGCHKPSYCLNCHNSGAIKVTHNDMLYKHTTAIDKAGGTQGCAYCHLPVYCQKCHKEPVLKDGVQSPPAIKVGPAA